jgi:UDP-N-acetylmuramate--alanine ligase
MNMRVIDRDLTEGVHSAYLIGIGGVGMSALARVLKHRGLKVAGSDMKANKTTAALNEEGILVNIGHQRTRFDDVDLFVYSSAISPDNNEFKIASASGKKIYHRAEILASLLNRARTSVAVTGTHGKTTTSSMISFVLSEIGRNPTCLVGGDVLNFGTNTVLGDSDLWVSEVDESDQTHELYAPNYAVITNLEEDHMDHYGDRENLRRSFERFLGNMRNPGLVIYSVDDPTVSRLVAESRKPSVGFGLIETADFSAQNIEVSGFGMEYDLYEMGFFSARMRLSVPGIHNVTNSLSAVAVLVQLGVDLDAIREALEKFRGARRRLEVKWQAQELMVVDDYAHHPTEVKASLRALAGMGKHLTVVFQPHRYTRTKYFFKEFARAFDDADELILTDIYSAGEPNPENIHVGSIYEEIVKNGGLSVKVLPKKEIIDYLAQPARQEGIVAFLGAGDIGEIADEFAIRCKNYAAA